MSNKAPSHEAPPSYDQAIGTSSSRPTTNTTQDTTHLTIPNQHDRNGIPAAARRSMEDESRPLPKGWVRSYDPTNNHQFFVDTTKDPPRSIWVHPYDDDQYLSTLSSEERERIEDLSIHHRKQSREDIIHEHTDEEDSGHYHGQTGELPPRPQDGKGKGKASLGRRLKDKVTGMTHEEREQERRRRAEAEQKAYEQHVRIRQAMTKAMQTGQPQFIGKDRDGKDVYIEPPVPPQAGYYGGGGYGYSPYGGYSDSPAVYSTPNATYIRPQQPYGRPYGYGYGGGLGMPLALGVGGGLLGGLMLGGLF